MTKWCLCVTEEREISTPKFYNTYKEAYSQMKQRLIDNILNSHHADGYLGENDEIINVEDANNDGMFNITPMNPGAEISSMWSNLNSSYNLDARLFRITIDELIA